jgi:hypothetical protein
MEEFRFIVDTGKGAPHQIRGRVAGCGVTFSNLFPAAQLEFVETLTASYKEHMPRCQQLALVLDCHNSFTSVSLTMAFVVQAFIVLLSLTSVAIGVSL